jgi:hypothetical protein
MSTTDLAMAPSTVERPRPAPRRPPGPSWALVALACAVLAAAGGVRWYQERRVERILEGGRTSPFPLKSLPMTLGTWQVPDGREEPLDVDVARMTRCVDYLRRSYVDDQTGVRAEVLILYGPSTIAHVPEVCYPGAGFKQVGGTSVLTFLPPEKLGKDKRPLLPSGPAWFYSLIFGKGEGGAAQWEQVAYSLRYNGRWTTALDFKTINRLPGLYKVQLVRRISERERLDAGNPCESLLEALLPELERRIAAAGAGAPGQGDPPRREAPR